MVAYGGLLMIMDAVSQEQLNNSNITVTGNGPVATLKNSLGGKQLVYFKGEGYNVQDGEPTPESPVDIQCLGASGTIEVKTCKKNIASKIDNNGYVYQYGNVLKCYCILKPNTYYTISFDSDTEGNHYYTNEAITDEQKHLRVVKGRNSVSIKTKANIKRNYLTNGVTLLKNYKEQPNKPMFDNFQLEEGNTATDYEPYQETVASLPISKPLYEGDYIEVYADGSGQIVRKMKEYKLTSADRHHFSISTANLGSIYSNGFLSANGFSDITAPKCNMLTRIENDDTYVYGTIKHGVTSLNLWLKDGVVFANNTEIGTYFDEHDIILVGELAEPVTKSLTAEQVEAFRQLYTFDKLTHVTADGTARLTVTGYQNNNDSMALFHKAGTEFIGEFKGDSTDVACDLNKYSCLIMMIEYGTVLQDTDVIPVELLLKNYFFTQTWYRVNADTLAIAARYGFFIELVNDGYITGSTDGSDGIKPKGLLYGVLK